MRGEDYKRLVRLQRDTAWFLSKLDELKKKYAGEYVAILQGQVIDHDASLETLKERLSKRYNVDHLVIEHVRPDRPRIVQKE